MTTHPGLSPNVADRLARGAGDKEMILVPKSALDAVALGLISAVYDDSEPRIVPPLLRADVAAINAPLRTTEEAEFAAHGKPDDAEQDAADAADAEVLAQCLEKIGSLMDRLERQLSQVEATRDAREEIEDELLDAIARTDEPEPEDEDKDLVEPGGDQLPELPEPDEPPEDFKTIQ